MKIRVIGSQDAVLGFALVGVQGEAVADAEALDQAIDAAFKDEKVGIVLITEDVAAYDRERVEHLMATSATPLVVEIPGPGGPEPDRPSLSEMIKQTIGVKI